MSNLHLLLFAPAEDSEDSVGDGHLLDARLRRSAQQQGCPDLAHACSRTQVDTELVYAYAKTGDMGALEEFMAGGHAANLQARSHWPPAAMRHPTKCRRMQRVQGQ